MFEGRRRYAVRIHAYCLIGNHFHKILAPAEIGAVSAYMQWVTGRYGCDLRFDSHSKGQGHVFQRRFWSQPIGTGYRHFLSVQRYVEANALAAGLVTRAEHWKWGSLWERETRGRSLVDPSPVPLPVDWLVIVNKPRPESTDDPGPDPYSNGEPDSEGSDPSMPNTSR